MIGGFRTALWQGFFADFFQDQEDFAEFFVNPGRHHSFGTAFRVLVSTTSKECGSQEDQFPIFAIMVQWYPMNHQESCEIVAMVLNNVQDPPEIV